MTKTGKTPKPQKENSKTHILGFELIPGDMEANVAGLMGVLEIEDLSEIDQLVSAFKINSNLGVNTTHIDDNKRKSALLLLALAARYQKDVFTLNASDIALIKAYFPEDLIQDALENPQTEHTSIRQLLLGESVIVSIMRKKF